MPQKNYLPFISDKHLFDCIGNLHKSYERAKANISKAKFYKNKVDVFKLEFDAKFNGWTEQEIIEAEILRQIDKSINNSIGTFHEEILGGIDGYEIGDLSGYDIKAEDNSLFADIKNKHNTMNSSAAESLFQKLKVFADKHKSAKCYWVQILAKSSFEALWTGDINGKEYSHSRVYKISGDKFYEKLTGIPDALSQLHKCLPTATTDFLKKENTASTKTKRTVIEELTDSTGSKDRSLFQQIAKDNFSYYEGFDL